MAATSHVGECRERLSNMYRALITEDTNWRAKLSRVFARKPRYRAALRVPPIAHRPAAFSGGGIRLLDHNPAYSQWSRLRALTWALRVRQPSGFGSPLEFPRRCAAPQPCASVPKHRLCSKQRRAGIAARLRLGSVGQWGAIQENPCTRRGTACGKETRLSSVVPRSNPPGQTELSPVARTGKLHDERTI
jgi:hypothetical protein